MIFRWRRWTNRSSHQPSVAQTTVDACVDPAGRPGAGVRVRKLAKHLPDASRSPQTHLQSCASLLRVQPLHQSGRQRHSQTSPGAQRCEINSKIWFLRNLKNWNFLAFEGVEPTAHTFHLHGHQMFITGWSSNDAAFENVVKRPVARDTITVPPSGTTSVVFQASNPGKNLFFHIRLRNYFSFTSSWIVYCNSELRIIRPWIGRFLINRFLH